MIHIRVYKMPPAISKERIAYFLERKKKKKPLVSPGLLMIIYLSHIILSSHYRQAA